jgi:Zn finger protein HypA/HybF involved in hydrogenase expression
MDKPEDANGEQAWVDGNAAAGILASVFELEPTRAQLVCACCGNAAAVAEQRAYALEMGAILRCPACASVTLRIASTPHGRFLDLRGADVVHFA